MANCDNATKDTDKDAEVENPDYVDEYIREGSVKVFALICCFSC